MRIVTLVLSATMVLLPACGGSSGDGDGGSGDGSVRRDGGDNEFTDAPVQTPCKFVDLVFSVDPSGSMVEELGAMATEVFPDFALALRGVGDGLENYRVGVIDACPLPANFHTRGEDTADCSFQSGEVWMDSSSTALDAEFECVGDIYRTSDCSGDNDDEQPASAAATSLEAPAITSVNAGFLRDDALLVIVAITDEDEQPVPSNDATGVYNRLVAIKGNVNKVVFLGIGGGPGGCSDGVYGSADESTMLHQITNMFIAAERGVWWDLCDGALGDGLTDAMTVIEQACDEFPDID